jgi:hypothetical protein
MVQNKEIDKEKLVNGKNDEKVDALCTNTKKLNGASGVLNEMDEHSEEEDEDDYLQYLLVVPSLDRNVSNRNVSLISESLASICTAIENRKEYAKIKQELMADRLMSIVNKDEKNIELKPEIEPSEIIKTEPDTPIEANAAAIEIEIEPQQQKNENNENEVNCSNEDEDFFQARKFKLEIPRAQLGM